MYTQDAKCLCLGGTTLCPALSLVGGVLGVFTVRQLLGWAGELLPLCWPPGHQLDPARHQLCKHSLMWRAGLGARPHKAKYIQVQGYLSCKRLLHRAGCQVSTHPCITQGWDVGSLECIFQADQ